MKEYFTLWQRIVLWFCFQKITFKENQIVVKLRLAAVKFKFGRTYAEGYSYWELEKFKRELEYHFFNKGLAFYTRHKARKSKLHFRMWFWGCHAFRMRELKGMRLICKVLTRDM